MVYSERMTYRVRGEDWMEAVCSVPHAAGERFVRGGRAMVVGPLDDWELVCVERDMWEATLPVFYADRYPLVGRVERPPLDWELPF